MSESPYLKYRDILLVQSYSAAFALQDFVLSCYNGNMAQFRGDALANFDKQHFGIFIELATHYYRYRENDPQLLKVGAAIWDHRRQIGRLHLARVAEHRAIDPKHYEDGSERDYYHELEWLERRTVEMREKGWIRADE